MRVTPEARCDRYVEAVRVYYDAYPRGREVHLIIT